MQRYRGTGARQREWGQRGLDIGVMSEVNNVAKCKGDSRERFKCVLQKMDDDEFWKWVRSWKDETVLLEEALDWDEKTIQEELKNYRYIEER